MRFDQQNDSLYVSEYKPALVPYAHPDALKLLFVRVPRLEGNSCAFEQRVGDRNVSVRLGFPESRLRSVDLAIGNCSASDYEGMRREYLALLGDLSLEPRDYPWGTVTFGFMAQSGEMWIEVRYP